MLAFGLLVGAILIIAGTVTYYLAPRIGPNPLFGVRIGYAYADRATWDKTNRLGGALMSLLGIGMIILGVVLQSLNPAPRDGMTTLTIVLLAGLIGAVAWMFVYARALAQGTTIARELVSVRFRWYYLAPVLVTFALLVAFMVFIYPTLPVNRVPSHFNFYDQPDGWQTRDQFVLTFLGMAVFVSALNVLVVAIATREPLIALGRLGTSWRLDPERGLIFAGTVFALVNLIFIAVLWNIWWFVTSGTLAFSFWVILWMIVPLIGFIIALFFLLGRREP